MDVKYINPFLQSTAQIFKTMIFMELQFCKPYLKTPDKPVSDISGSVGVTGKIEGVVSVCFDKETACIVASRFLNETLTELSHPVQDSVGEIANIIVGGAKRYFQQMHMDCKIAIPSVVVGEGHILSFPPSVPVMVMPFLIKEINKTFFVEVCLKI